MSKNHDENKDLRLVSRIARVDYASKTIQTPKSTVIGIRTWGRLDYLVHYCGWHFCYNNDVRVSHILPTGDVDGRNTPKRDTKRTTKNNVASNRKRR